MSIYYTGESPGPGYYQNKDGEVVRLDDITDQLPHSDGYERCAWEKVVIKVQVGRNYAE